MSKGTDKAKEYFQSLAQEQKLSKDETATFLKVLENEKIAEDMGLSLLRHDEFSRNMDAHKKDVDEFGKTKEEWKGWYADFLAAKRADGDKFADYDQIKAENASYQKEYGDLDGTHKDTPPAFDASKFISREQLAKELATRDGYTTTVIKKANQLSMNHFQEFGKPLDMDALEKTAVEGNVSLDEAYSQIVTPARTEVSKVAGEKAVKEAYEKGRQDTMTKHKLPTDDKPSVPHPLFDQKDADKAGSPREAFVTGYEETAKA